MPSICLCMITKDEEKNIERCIKSVKGLAEEIVMVDTGSTDDTVLIAQGLGAKVYHYPWDGSFARARNFAIKKAESDWLLLLDADETLDPDSFDIILNFIRTTSLDGAHFRIRNYTGNFSPDVYSLHNAFRLLRKSDRYYFKGEIHEQIVDDSGENLSACFATLEAIVHHYGYLDEVIKAKQKRQRNIPILTKQLEQNPKEAFTLFNMGNEYLAMHDYKTALDYYEKALVNLENRNLAYVPHLFLRCASCYENLGKDEKALQVLQAGLQDFPRCTDYVFRQASISYKLKRYTLAIEHFEACLKMGVPPPSLELVPGCGTYMAAFQLGELYQELEDYQRAIRYYDLALAHKSNLYPILYRLGNIFNKMYADKDQAAQRLLSYFTNTKYTPNALLGADILTEEGLYQQAGECLANLADYEKYEIDLAYVNARIYFYQLELAAASPLLQQICLAKTTPGKILRGIRPISAVMFFSAGLMLEDEQQITLALSYIKDFCTESEYAAATLMGDIHMGSPPPDPHFKNAGKSELTSMLNILNMILKCHYFDLFEQMLPVLNYVDSKDVLLKLAGLYDANGLLPLAADHVIRSIKELDAIDIAGADILLRQLIN